MSWRTYARWFVIAFITLARLLQQRNTAPTPISVGLQAVRHWLRQVTVQELRTWIEELRRSVDVDAEDMEYLTEWLAPYGPKATPLNDPVHWAGFTYVGA